MLVLTRSQVEELLDLDALVEAVAAAQADLSAGCRLDAAADRGARDRAARACSG